MNTDRPSVHLSVDALLPAEMARRAEQVGIAKATMPLPKMFVLAVLAGAFIALGAIFSTTVTAGAAERMPFGLMRLVGGIAFSLGLILVVVGGAELFTGNNLIVMATAAGKLSWRQLWRNWTVVYLGNLCGSVATAGLIYFTEQYRFGAGAVGENMLGIAQAKCQLGFAQALALGIACNVLVCLAVWLSLGARSTTDKILAVVFPIAAFVAAGFEHCVANMYYIPIALFVKSGAGDPFWSQIGASAADYADLTWGNFFLVNLVPVTLGNIFGGAVMVGLVYWFVYLRDPAAE